MDALAARYALPVRTFTTVRKRPLIPAACLAAAILTPSAEGATLTSSGVLTPSFSRAVPNYTTTCVGSSIRLGASVLPATSVQIGTAAAKKGSRTTVVKLAPSKRIIVKITEGGSTTTHSIRCTPTDFPKLVSRGQMPGSVQLATIEDISGRIGNGGKSIAYAVIVDRFGVPIWWRKFDTSLVNFFTTSEGKLAFGRSNGPLEFRDFTGRLVSSITPAGGKADAHEAIPAGGGNWYLGQHSGRSAIDLSGVGLGKSENVYDSIITKTTPAGASLWSWNSATHFSTDELLLPQINVLTTGRYVDVAHINSFADDGQGGLIVSARNTSAVYRVNLSDGSIDWKLGGTPTAQSLTVLGDTDIGLQHNLLGQHDARPLPDGTITIFDNGSSTSRYGTVETRSPRALRVRIDPLARTATVIEVLRDSEITTSSCCGNARRFSDGSWLIAWGRSSHVRGYDASGTPVFWLDYRNTANYTYRVTPIQSSSITEAALVAGMDKQS